MAGIFYGIGVGPGDPELLTLKAIHIIQQADVVIAPKTEKKEESLALSIVKPFLQTDTEVIKLVFPMVSDSQIQSEAWVQNKNIIVNLLRNDKKVAFLTLGDPMFYSTYIYVFRLLQDCGCSIETIPGITAFCAIGSRLNRPIVEGDSILSVVPATMDMDKLDNALAMADNVVLMKVYKNFPEIAARLAKNGLLENAVMISRCGLEDEQVVTQLAALDKRTPLNYLSTIITRRDSMKS